MTLVPYKLSDLFRSKRGGDKGAALRKKLRNRKRNKLARAKRRHNIRTGHIHGRQ